MAFSQSTTSYHIFGSGHGAKKISFASPIQGSEKCKSQSRLFVETDCKYALEYQTLYGPNREDLVWKALRTDAEFGTSLRNALVCMNKH